MIFGKTFTAKASEGSYVLPTGWYNFSVLSSDVKDTRSGGKYLHLCFKVIDGPYLDRRVNGMFNIENQNPKAVEIAEQMIGALLSASGLTAAEKSEDFLGIYFSGFVTSIVSEQYGTKNEVKKFKPITNKTTKVEHDDIPF